jgi:CHAD domain-containing protein
MNTEPSAPHRHLERELKLDVDVDWTVPDLGDVLPGVTAERQPERLLRSVYYDTADFRLLRAKISLRHRRETLHGSEDLWTLKLPTSVDGAVLAREELNWPGPVDPDAPPEPVLDLLLAHSQGAPLVPVVTLVNRRRPVVLRTSDGRELAEIDHDEVAVETDNGPARGFSEVEIELTSDSALEVMEAVAERLRASGAQTSTRRSKLAEALGEQAGRQPIPTPVGKADDAEAVVRAALTTGLSRLLDHDLGVRLDSDPEHVHKARVATRRLRSDLRTFRKLLDTDWVAETRAELKWVAAALGRVRDGDVFVAWLEQAVQAVAMTSQDQRGGSELLARAHQQRAAAYQGLVEELRSGRYLALLRLLEQATRHLPRSGDAQAAALLREPARAVLPPLVRKPWRQLRAEVTALDPHPSDDALHQVRIRAKQLRYASEAVVAAAGRPARLTAKAAGRLQEILGDVHDAVVAETWLREAVTAEEGASSAATLMAGQLIHAARLRRDRGRSHWREAWADLDRPSLRSWTKGRS